VIAFISSVNTIISSLYSKYLSNCHYFLVIFPVIAMTAGATDEDTYGVFCDDPKYKTCLAGLFSYYFSHFLKEVGTVQTFTV
jgi:Peptidase C13 family.